MARGVNKVIIVGRLGQDPDVRSVTSGTVTNLSVATDESYKNKSGEMVKQTEWHKVAMFGRLAEIAAEYLRKGSQVYIEGKLRTRKWQDKQGQDRYTTEIIADQMQMLGGGEAIQPARPAAARPSRQAELRAEPYAQQEPLNDDIPF